MSDAPEISSEIPDAPPVMTPEEWRESIAAAIGCDVTDIKTVKELRLRARELRGETKNTGH